MTFKELLGSGFTLWLLVLIAVPSKSVAREHYCQQNNIDTIKGETEGKIISRRQGESYYGNNYECSWWIDAGENKKIKLTVLSTNLQWAPTYTTCSSYDNLQIFDGQSKSGSVITSLCGARNPYHIISQGQYLFLNFETTHQNFGDLKGVELHFVVFDNNTCPPGWFPSDQEYCISLNNEGSASWLNSQTVCSYSRANLASITSEEEYQLIYAYGVNKTNQAWLGLSDLRTEGSFTWIDRQKLAFQRQILDSRPDDDDRSDCVAQDFTTGDWIVERCDIDLNYVCKAKKDGSTKIYSAVQSSDSPETGGKEDRINFIIIIAVVLAVVVVGLVVVVCICRRRRKNKRKKRHHIQTQELSATRYPHGEGEPTQESLHLTAPTQDSRLTPVPSAPTADSIMMYNPQIGAPPTYEESQYHHVAPSGY